LTLSRKALFVIRPFLLYEAVMTNIFGTPEKVATKSRLFEIGVAALEKEGWKVERIAKSGKASLRLISKGGVSKRASIRTTQDTAIAFPRIAGDTGWRTLDEVDVVVPVSVDDPENPQAAKVHMINGDEMRDRFNRAYAARKAAGHTIPEGQGVWLSLYMPEAQSPVSLVGAGAGLKHPPIAVVPLAEKPAEQPPHEASQAFVAADAPFTIAEAKRRLAATFGVTPEAIKITIEA
jgi:hypothetical protein